MANDLVVQLGAKLDQFAADMNQAGDMADSAVSRIESRFASLNPGLGGFSNFGTIMTGAAGAAAGLLAILEGVNKTFADIAKNAEYTGLTLERFQQVKFAAQVGGVGDAQATADLRNVARLLADAKENENSLTKLLDANNIKYKDRNDKIISTNQLLSTAIGLINRFQSLPEKVEAAKALGLSEQWVEAIKGGNDQFQALANSAAAAGAVIDNSTIQKAVEFDREWEKASLQWGINLKAAAASVLPEIDRLIQEAAKIFSRDNLESHTEGQLQKLRDVGVPESGGITINVTPETEKALQDYRNAATLTEAIMAGVHALTSVVSTTSNSLRFSGPSEPIEYQPFGPYTGDKKPPPSIDDPAKLASRKKASEEQRDAYEVEIDRLNKRIAVTNADTEASRENIGVKEQLRTEATLYAALERAEIPNAEKYADAIYALSERAGQAALNLAKANELTAKLNSASQQIGSALSTAFADAVVEGKNLNDVLSSLIKTLEKAAINSVFASIFNAPSTGGVSPILSLLGLGHNAGGTDNWRGGPTWVGENGPEIVNLPRGAQVVPNAVASKVGGGTSIYNNFNVAGDVNPATIDRLGRAVVAAHRKIDGQARIMVSSQRMQATGVG